MYKDKIAQRMVKQIEENVVFEVSSRDRHANDIDLPCGELSENLFLAHSVFFALLALLSAPHFAVI